MRQAVQVKSWSSGRLVATVVTALALAACSKKEESGGDVAVWTPANLKEVKGVPVASLRQAIEARLSQPRPAPLDEDQWRHVRKLYATFAQGPLWMDRKGPDHGRVRPLARSLVDAHSDALRLDAYPLAELQRTIADLESADRPSAEQIASADVLATAAYAALGEDLLTGQIDPRKVSQAWHIDPQEEQVDSALARTLRNGSLERSIATLRPQDPGYETLRHELVRYRELAARGDWAKVPEGRALKPGDRGSAGRLEALRNRLRAEGLLDAGTASRSSAERRDTTGPSQSAGSAASDVPYDAALAGAVARFQERHGIPVDSILGPGTVQSLNLPVTYRLGQIAANLERHRWLPRSLGSRYLIVNVPAFRLEAHDGGKTVLEMKVIVGAEYEERATPVFSDSMQFVVFRPYWNVPDSIAAKEIFSKAETDPGYLERNDYELYQSEGKTRVRQRPGPKNALGLVKFMFPNDFDIYLHDTPDDRLFDKDVRAFSHGCIRVEKPEELAQWVLGWDATRVERQMQSRPDNKTVNLPRKLPVFIVYFTAFAREGTLYFGNDLYDRDDALVHAVANGQSSGEAVRAAEALLKVVD
jgi:L,D-transpeptidase YcbB